MNAVSLPPPNQRLYEFNCQHHEPATRNTEPRHVSGILSLMRAPKGARQIHKALRTGSSVDSFRAQRGFPGSHGHPRNLICRIRPIAYASTVLIPRFQGVDRSCLRASGICDEQGQFLYQRL